MPLRTLSANDPPKPHEIIQVGNEHSHWYRCLVVVTEVRLWGIVGYTTIPSAIGQMPNDAFVRLPWEDMLHPTGGVTQIRT